MEGHIATLKEQLAKAEATTAAERERVADLTTQLLKITGQMTELQQAHEAERQRSWWRRLAG